MSNHFVVKSMIVFFCFEVMAAVGPFPSLLCPLFTFPFSFHLATSARVAGILGRNPESPTHKIPSHEYCCSFDIFSTAQC